MYARGGTAALTMITNLQELSCVQLYVENLWDIKTLKCCAIKFKIKQNLSHVSLTNIHGHPTNYANQLYDCEQREGKSFA